MMLALPASAAGLMTDRGGAIILAQATPAPAAPAPITGFTNTAPQSGRYSHGAAGGPACRRGVGQGGRLLPDRRLSNTCCKYTVGNGEIGTNRALGAAGNTNEIDGRQDATGYAYSQPLSPIYYHGNLSVEVVDATHSNIVYDLLYDNSRREA